MLVAQGAQALHQLFRRRQEATFTLNRLQDDRGDVLRLGIVLEDALDRSDGVVDAHTVQFVREQCAEDAAWHQAHASGVRHDLAGQAQGHHGTAVITAGEGDDASAASGSTGDLDGVFNGFGAGGDQQGLLVEVAWDQLVDLFAQLYVGLVSQHLEAGVADLGQLLLHGCNHFRVQVAGVQYCDAAGEVDQFAAFNVDHGRVLRGVDEDRVDLADATWDGSYTTLHQGFVGFAHNALIAPTGMALLFGGGWECSRTVFVDRLS
ncbi:hypothetical protein D9M71_374350 [compost metagenome]